MDGEGGKLQQERTRNYRPMSTISFMSLEEPSRGLNGSNFMTSRNRRKKKRLRRRG